MDDKEQFIAHLYAPARKVSRETDVAWETIIAQAAQETGWGQHVLAGTNNVFNIKADKSWHGPRKAFHVWEIENGHKVWKDQDFRVYASVDEALHDRIAFLRANPRYSKAGLFDAGTVGNLQGEAAALQRAGYATDPHYAQNLTALFNGRTMQRAIARAETIGVAPAAAEHQQPFQTDEGVRSAKSASEVVHLQQLLTNLGYRDAHGQRLHIDGVSGRHTDDAIRAFRHAHGLPEVGHVGPRTRKALRRSEHSPSPVDPAHPDHALAQQIARGVDGLGDRLGSVSTVQLQQLKASLLPLAREHGIARADHVVLSTTGDNIFLVQGRLEDPAHRRAHMSTQAGMETPLSESGRRLEHLDVRHRQTMQTHQLPHPIQGIHEPHRLMR